MKTVNINVLKYEADEGKVFDYKEPHFDENGEEDHLNAKLLYLSINDSIDNYIEIEQGGQ